MARPNILVIGSTNTDMVAEVPSLPVPGQTILGGAFRMTPGGKGANQAVAAARAGGAVTFISAVGGDAFGSESIQRFETDGIETRYIAVKNDSPSGVALILVDFRGENVIAVAPGANAELCMEDIEKAADAFPNARIMLAQLEVPMPCVLLAAKKAKEAGCIFLLNPAPMPPEGLPEELIRCVDILTPNEGELMTLVPDASSLEDAASSVLSRGPKVLVVTQGKQGATVFTPEETFHVPAMPVQAVDTVGAGDCFSASLAVAYAEGKSIKDAVRFAIVSAALSTTKSGAQASMPTRSQVETLL